jgi:hypothetical protein
LLERYLGSRDITIPIPQTLRFLRSCWHDLEGGFYSAMVARVDDVDGLQIGIHRTYLRADGLGKASVGEPRLALGPMKGGAVRLAPASELLLVGEGLETGLSAMQACGLPTWVATSTSGLKNLILPLAVRKVVILVDHDLNGAGERAARVAKQRWLREGRRVRFALPPDPGFDFNDILLGRPYAQIVEMRNAE